MKILAMKTSTLQNNGGQLFRHFFTGSNQQPKKLLATAGVTVSNQVVTNKCPVHQSPEQNAAPSTFNSYDKSSTAPKPFSEMPTPKGLPFIGTYLEYARNGGGKNLHTFTLKRHKELGPIFKEKTGVTHIVSVADPDTFRDVTFHEGKVPTPFRPSSFEILMKQENMKRGLFFLQGEEWIQARRIFNNLLLKKHDFSDMYDQTENVINEQLIKWHHVSQRNGGHLPNIEMKLTEFVLATLASFFMGRTYDNHYASSLPKEAETFHSNAQIMWDTTMKMQLIPAEFAQKWGLKVWKRFEASTKTVLGIGDNWCNLVKDDLTSSGRDGLIHLFLKLAPDLNFDDMKRFFIDFIQTSETEANMKTWLIYAMAQNPQAQDKVVDELQRVCGKGQKLTSRHLEDTHYFRACVQEIMRLYPAVIFTTRFLEKECVIGNYQIPANTLFALNLFACQRDAKHFPNPEKFWPERWFRVKSDTKKSLGDEQEDIWDAENPIFDSTTAINRREPYLGVTGSSAHPNMVFGWGWGATRNCVFRKVSLVRMHLFLGRLLQEFYLKCDTVQPTMRTLLVPDKDMNLRIAKRP